MRRIPVTGVLFFAALAAAAELPQGLALRFSCDEFRNSGSVLPDVTGSNNHARVSGVKYAAGGRLGAACEFTGKNSYLQVTNGPALNSRRVTLCAWFKTGKAEWPDRTLFDRQAANGYALALLAGNKDGRQGRLRFTVCGHDCLSDAGLADNAWHHAAASYDGENLKLYVDGQLQKQVTAWKGELPSGGADLTIGMNRSNPSSKDKEAAFEGLMDEIAVYSRALSDEEVKRALAETKPKFTKQQVERRLAELKELYDRGLLLQDFYERKVKECEVEK
jgi:hypothetical protein